MDLDFGEEKSALQSVSLLDMWEGKFDANQTVEEQPAESGEAPEEEAPPAPHPKGRGRKGRGGRGGSKKGKGRGKSAGADAVKTAKKAPVSTCIVPGCCYPKYPGSRFCSLGEHKKSFDNMTYQRRTRKDISEAQKQKVDIALF